MGKPIPPPDRFFAKVDVGLCWEWTGCVTSNGYGQFRDGKVVLAHRWAYEHLVGPVPEGLELDHLCRVRHCVNPDHLEPVTRAENIRRGISRIATARYWTTVTHCSKGHEFTHANTYINVRGVRCCKICIRDAQRRYKEKKR